MHTIVKAEQAAVRQIAENKIARNVITKDISPHMSLAVTEATNYYEKETCAYGRVYYVLEGQIRIDCDGVSSVLAAGDACFMDKGTEYEMKETFKAVVVNQSAFGL